MASLKRQLVAAVGEAGKRLHTGRSRNDQVATDFRLFARDAIDQSVEAIAQLQKIIVKRAEAEIDVVLPGFTHLQKAQTILWSHFLMSYFEMLERDKGRLLDASKGEYSTIRIRCIGGGIIILLIEKDGPIFRFCRCIRK